MKAWKADVEGRCDKIRGLQCTADDISKAGHGKASNLVDKLNHLTDEMNALLTRTAVRQVSSPLSSKVVIK